MHNIKHLYFFKKKEVLEDIQLIWDNVYLYYKKNTTMYDYAKKLEDETKQRIQNIEEGKFYYFITNKNLYEKVYL